MTRYVSATKPNRLMLFRKIIAVYCEDHRNSKNVLCENYAEFYYVTRKACGTYRNHWNLKG
jgi:uncharacterized metal-binding protein